MDPRFGDMTPKVDLTVGDGTGAARSRRPVYVDLLPPCNNACPAGENIQAWLALAQAGRYREAWETLVADNPMPAVHGRVCYHPCESSCNRAEADAPVSIHAVERFLGDLATAENWQFRIDTPPTGKKAKAVMAEDMQGTGDPLVPRKYFSPETSGLKADVSPSGGNFDFELTD